MEGALQQQPTLPVWRTNEDHRDIWQVGSWQRWWCGWWGRRPSATLSLLPSQVPVRREAESPHASVPEGIITKYCTGNLKSYVKRPILSSEWLFFRMKFLPSPVFTVTSLSRLKKEPQTTWTDAMNNLRTKCVAPFYYYNNTKTKIESLTFIFILLLVIVHCYHLIPEEGSAPSICWCLRCPQ